MKKQALILINMINDFLSPKGALYLGSPASKIIPLAVELLDEFRARKELIVFSSDAHQAQDHEFLSLPRHGLRGTWGARILEELSPLPGEHSLAKRFYDATFSSTLADMLKRNHIDETHLVGVVASLDYFETATSLFYHGHKLVLYEKGTADFKDKEKKNAFQILKRHFGADIR
jgi:nicotinamidase-related amidase